MATIMKWTRLFYTKLLYILYKFQGCAILFNNRTPFPFESVKSMWYISQSQSTYCHIVSLTTQQQLSH